MEEMINVVGSEATSIEKRPSADALTPLLVPLTMTEAAGTGLPSLSITLPLTCTLCAKIVAQENMQTSKLDSLLLMCIATIGFALVARGFYKANLCYFFNL